MLRRLGSFENALLISDHHSPFHVVSVLQMVGAPPPETLLRALELVQACHPLLNVRIDGSNRHASFESLDQTSMPFTLHPRQHAEDWLAITERELANRIDVHRGPLFRFNYLYQAPGQPAEAILSISHTIADSVSLVSFWSQLLETTNALISGNQPALETQPLQPPADEHFPINYRGVKGTLPTIAYAGRQMVAEIGYQIRASGKNPLKVQPKSAGHVLTCLTPADISASLVNAARRHKVTLNSVLNASIMMAVNSVIYSGNEMPMRTFVFADLRPYLTPPVDNRSLSADISMLRYTLPVGRDKPLWELAAELNSQAYRSFKRGEKFLAVRMSVPLMRMFTSMKSMRMGHTALNYNGPLLLDKNYGDITISGLHGFVSPYDLGPLFPVQVSLFEDRFIWDMTYLEADMDRDKAVKIADEIQVILNEALR